MKKNIILATVLVALCIFVVGCGKKEEKKEEKIVEWVSDITQNSMTMSDKELKIFKAATKDSGKNYEPIAILGTQVVAGTNYMFLVTEDSTSYKVLVIYNTLKNKSSIIATADFDYSKYLGKNTQFEASEETGGWTVTAPAKPVQLDEKVQAAFDSAMEEYVGATYYPIAQVAHTKDDKPQYAILCYGKLATATADTGIYLVTLDSANNEFKSITYIDIADFNK